MTRKDEIMQSVLDNEDLQKFGNYDTTDYTDMYAALESDETIVSCVAKLVNGDFGTISISNTETENKKAYQSMSNYLQDNLLL